MVISKLQQRIYLIVFFCVLTIAPGCNKMTEEILVDTSKKNLEKYFAESESIEYRNITIVKSLDDLKYYVDDDKVSDVLITKAPKLSDYPGFSNAQFKLLVTQAENQFVKSIKKKVEALNTDIEKGLYSKATGVCLEFKAKNENDDSEKFEKALCLYAEGKDEVDCLNIKLGADKSALFNIDLSAVCK